VNQYDYPYDNGDVITNQSATVGNGVNIVFMGDCFDAKDIAEGYYEEIMNEAIEHFFAVEPYKTYRDYFNVYTAISVSPESGIGGVNTIINNRFNTTAKGGMTLSGRHGDSDFNMIFEYACKAPTVSGENLDETLIVMIPNTEDYGGICYMYDDGAAIAYCPMSDYGYPTDFRGLIQHEAGGHGFSKLADEYAYEEMGAITTSEKNSNKERMTYGWFKNVDFTSNKQTIKWSHFLSDERYAGEGLGAYEGGMTYWSGVWRPTYNSIMRHNTDGFNAPSREAIYYRINKLAYGADWEND
jgi:hypothetical protein